MSKQSMFMQLALIMGLSSMGSNGGIHIDMSPASVTDYNNRIRANRAKPYKGMHYYFDYGVWAINEKNAKRKSIK